MRHHDAGREPPYATKMWRSLVLTCAALSCRTSRADDWAVHVPDGRQVADLVAAEHGLVNVGEAVPDSNVFHFKRRRRSQRSTDDDVDEEESLSLHRRLSNHAAVSSAESQASLRRVKRAPTTNEVCFINTLATESRESRRCVFPFKYKGRSYVSCTSDHSANLAEWCATEVRPDGEVVHGQWGDCDKRTISCFTINSAGQRERVPQRPPSRPPPQFGGIGRPLPPPPFRHRPPPQLHGLPPLPGRTGAIPPRPPPLLRQPSRVVENDVDTSPSKPVDPSVFKTYANDKMWPKMWFLNRGDEGMDMNVEDAWLQGYTGKGVKVTILDDGVEHTHEDLKGNYDPESSYDLNDDDENPFPRYDFFNSQKHGTRCAGTVAATANNSFCAVGVAYNAKIGGVRLLDGLILDVLEAKAISFNRNHIDVYSASWGPDDNGKTVDGPGKLARIALEDGATKGRGGKGSIFVWASGNGGKYADNCNCDGYTTSIYTLSVSSASENGLVPWYSEPCSSSLATTYSSGSKRFAERKVVTTDLHGKCTDQHTGTSASSPMAAGIVALALEANPNLTWRDVQHLTVRTARPRGNLKARDWDTNGVGLDYSHSFGFGLMNAGAMTRLARDWKTVPEQKKCSTLQNVLEKPLVIGPGQETIVAVDASKCSFIQHLEHVQLHIDLKTTSKRGDLQLTLRSPAKTTSILLDPRPFDDIRTGLDLFSTWPMMSVHFWGESVERKEDAKWELVVNNEGDRAATLRDFQFTFHGTSEDPQPGVPIRYVVPKAQDKDESIVQLDSEVTFLEELGHDFDLGDDELIVILDQETEEDRQDEPPAAIEVDVPVKIQIVPEKAEVTKEDDDAFRPVKSPPPVEEMSDEDDDENESENTATQEPEAIVE